LTSQGFYFFGMTLSTFRLLSPRAQLLVVMTEATYLAHRRGENERVLSLYYLPSRGLGFFSEVGFDDRQEHLEVLRSFSNSAPLDEYTYGVRLPA
jgi:hypothetical protein